MFALLERSPMTRTVGLQWQKELSLGFLPVVSFITTFLKPIRYHWRKFDSPTHLHYTRHDHVTMHYTLHITHYKSLVIVIIIIITRRGVLSEIFRFFNGCIFFVPETA